MTDWIEHTGDTCPVDPETVVEVALQYGAPSPPKPARLFLWTEDGDITHYRIITPAPTPPLFLGGDPAKPPEPEMTKPPNYLDTLSEEQRRRILLSCPPKPEPDLITLRLECLKLAAGARVSHTDDLKDLADILLHYVLNGSVDKAGK